MFNAFIGNTLDVSALENTFRALKVQFRGEAAIEFARVSLKATVSDNLSARIWTSFML